jgi:phosphoglycolate phosphatase-like HAD superfamily hydrolase
MRNGYRLLVFDWDGTLMDSAAHIVAGLRAALVDLGAAPTVPYTHLTLPTNREV